MIQQLVQIGFNEEQAKVYIALLELGKASIARIVRKSNVSKKLSYKALDFLADEGFVAAEGKRKRVFFVTDVESIGGRLRDRLKRFENLVPQLYAQANAPQSNRSFNIFYGEQTVRNLIKQEMRKQPRESIFLCIESAGFNFVDFMKGGANGMDFDIYERIRLNRNVRVHVLFVLEQKEQIIIKYRRQKREIRSLTSSFSNSIAGMYIWHNRVFLVNQSGGEMTLVELNSREIRQGFVSYFDSLWQRAELKLLEK